MGVRVPVQLKRSRLLLPNSFLLEIADRLVKGLSGGVEAAAQRHSHDTDRD